MPLYHHLLFFLVYPLPCTWRHLFVSFACNVFDLNMVRSFWPWILIKSMCNSVDPKNSSFCLSVFGLAPTTLKTNYLSWGHHGLPTIYTLNLIVILWSQINCRRAQPMYNIYWSIEAPNKLIYTLCAKHLSLKWQHKRLSAVPMYENKSSLKDISGESYQARYVDMLSRIISSDR